MCDLALIFPQMVFGVWGIPMSLIALRMAMKTGERGAGGLQAVACKNIRSSLSVSSALPYNLASVCQGYWSW